MFFSFVLTLPALVVGHVLLGAFALENSQGFQPIAAASGWVYAVSVVLALVAAACLAWSRKLVSGHFDLADFRPQLKGIGIAVLLPLVLIGGGLAAIAYLTSDSGWLPAIRMTPDLVWPVVAFCLFAALGEELLFRGVLLGGLLSRLGKWKALCLSALMFGAAHWMNPGAGFLDVLLVATGPGILLGLLYLEFGGLPTATVAHFTWNFALFLNGRPVSGFTAAPEPIQSSGTALVTGGAFGIEGSIIIAVGTLAANVMLLGLSRSRAQPIAHEQFQ